MRLQQRTDYALRALIFLADAGGATPSAIAEAHGVSSSHMAKVMQQLSAAGFVDAKRGRGKVSTLARPPESITVGEVVRALEPVELAECFRDGGECVLRGRCRLQRALDAAAKAFFESLEGATIASLSDRHTRRLFSLMKG